MGRRKKPYQKQAFESTGKSSDTSANIYMSMLLSEAWMDLTATQQRLYLYCKAQYYAEKKKPYDDRKCFTMNQSKWSKLYRLYKESNAKGFYRDMEALIDHGFIKCVFSGAISHQKSVYRFSSMWQNYGTPAFEVLPNSMTTGMVRRRYLRKGLDGSTQSDDGTQ